MLGHFHWHRSQLPLSQPGCELAWLPSAGCWSRTAAVSTLLEGPGAVPLTAPGWVGCCKQLLPAATNSISSWSTTLTSLLEGNIRRKSPAEISKQVSTSLNLCLLIQSYSSSPYSLSMDYQNYITTPSLYSLNFQDMHIWQS